MSALQPPLGSKIGPDDITIAVTVYSRRDFVLGTIRSALEQSLPVKVMVVEDCGPDPSLRDFILREFGTRIDYFRNPVNRGIFDNWNACLEYCRTPWISILHDDDALRPAFVETMTRLASQAPGRALYFGRSAFLSPEGVLRPPPPVSWPEGWRDLDLKEFADECLVFFPGHLMHVGAAKSLGGFKAASYFTGDWDMWFRLALNFGAAQTAAEVSISRSHFGEDRGTSRVERQGWKWALDNTQRKRNLARLRERTGGQIPFDRAKLLRRSPIPSRALLRHAPAFSRRMLRYNAWLFTHSSPPNARYAALQWMVRIFGSGSLRLGSKLCGKDLRDAS